MKANQMKKILILCLTLTLPSLSLQAGKKGKKSTESKSFCAQYKAYMLKYKEQHIARIMKQQKVSRSNAKTIFNNQLKAHAKIIRHLTPEKIKKIRAEYTKNKSCLSSCGLITKAVAGISLAAYGIVGLQGLFLTPSAPDLELCDADVDGFAFVDDSGEVAAFFDLEKEAYSLYSQYAAELFADTCGFIESEPREADATAVMVAEAVDAEPKQDFSPFDSLSYNGTHLNLREKSEDPVYNYCEVVDDRIVCTYKEINQ